MSTLVLHSRWQGATGSYPQSFSQISAWYRCSNLSSFNCNDYTLCRIVQHMHQLAELTGTSVLQILSCPGVKVLRSRMLQPGTKNTGEQHDIALLCLQEHAYVSACTG